MPLSFSTAACMAKNWRRGDTAVRANIERAITVRDGWAMFRRSESMGLVARLDPNRPRNADCHFYTRGARDGI